MILFAIVGLLLSSKFWFFTNKEPQRQTPALKYGDKIYVGYDTAKGDFGPFEGWVAQFKETKL